MRWVRGKGERTAGGLQLCILKLSLGVLGLVGLVGFVRLVGLIGLIGLVGEDVEGLQTRSQCEYEEQCIRNQE